MTATKVYQDPRMPGKHGFTVAEGDVSVTVWFKTKREAQNAKRVYREGGVKMLRKYMGR